MITPTMGMMMGLFVDYIRLLTDLIILFAQSVDDRSGK